MGSNWLVVNLYGILGKKNMHYVTDTVNKEKSNSGLVFYLGWEFWV